MTKVESSKGGSFKDMFTRGEIVVAKQRRVSVGEEVEGVVGHVGKDAVLVDLDDKQQAYFELPDLSDASGKPIVKPGDRVRGFVVSTDGSIRLARRFGKGEASVDHLAVAQEKGTPVEGKITAVNKGGVEVELAGVRAFCPASQLDDRFVADTSAFVGRTLAFVVTKVEGRNVVVSRRALLERESKAAREETLASLAIGDIKRGRVTQLRDFGAFVDIGGLEGLIPLRELSHERVKAEDVVSIGDVVEVQIKGVERKTNEKGEKIEITLSLKALAADPWTAIDAVAPVGRVVAGQVTRLSDFGAFVRIGTGVEGLLHVSELGARVKHASEALEIGQSILVRVLSVDPVKRRIALAPAAEGATVGSEDRGPAVVVGRVVSAIVEKVENFGIVVQIEGSTGRAGRAVIPNAETGTRPGADLRREFAQGGKVTAKIIDAGDGARRGARLSIRAARDDAERADFDTYKAGTRDQARMGTLGDLLKKKIS
jgi:small subunit ribosomal protein S1